MRRYVSSEIIIRDRKVKVEYSTWKNILRESSLKPTEELVASEFNCLLNERKGIESVSRSCNGLDIVRAENLNVILDN